MELHFGTPACVEPPPTNEGQNSVVLEVAEPTAGPHPPPLKHEWSGVVVTERLLSILLKLNMVMGQGLVQLIWGECDDEHPIPSQKPY